MRSKWLLILAMGSVWACSGDDDDDLGPPPPIPNDIFADLGEPAPYATAAQLATFQAGHDVAERRFSREDGLGPDFNVSFCGACHEKPTTGGSSPRYRNFLLVGQMLSDGSFAATKKNGVQTQYEPGGTIRSIDDAATNVTATRNGTPFFGVGLLAELPNSAILLYADPDDADGDGISGRPNFDRGFVGRFGRKSQTVSIEGFIRGPLFNHLGVTSNPLSEAMKAALPVPSQAVPPGVRALSAEFGTTSRGQAAAPDEPTEDMDGVPDPELSEQDLFDLVSFAMLLGAPKPDAPTETSMRGEAQFEALLCAKCHVPTLVSPRGSIPVYSDLLLHDMGPDLADGFVMKEASGSEFRTQPLWGLVATGPYLHDGRADTIDEAIRLHGGEATGSRDRYAVADDSARADLLAFLTSLGGSKQVTEGLLPPDAPVPAAGTAGGPQTSLSPADEARFVEGRALFDKDFGPTRGLGPAFNGDSCRACHFDPVIGGAGPMGVNVVRHGYVDGTVFREPTNGTMAHRLLTDPKARPYAEGDADIYELRQTPSVFGLGQIINIPDATIMGLEDPNDLDGDGIRGVAHRKLDGRVGRLGWKAGVPDLADFARDAMSNELGVTVPDDGTSTFGFNTDTDEATDPEITGADLDTLVFFMEQLAAPARLSTDAAAEARGETRFDEVGCAGCHIPSLDDRDGNPVNLYSDLLLHDVAVAGTLGIADGMATMTQFRTAPLWGARDTAPYMHDGRSSTLEDAIAEHDGEATAARMAYEQLAGTDRADLLAFLQSL